MPTHATILDRVGITAPDDLLADIDVPVLTGAQRQGDVGIWPTATASPVMQQHMTPVPANGIAVVRGESTGGNAHILHADGPVLWQPADPRAGDLLALGTLHVPAGSIAWLIHTDEHGANGIGPGTYRVTGKREMADDIRRVAD